MMNLRVFLLCVVTSSLPFASPLLAQNSYGIGLATGTQVRLRTVDDPQKAVTGKLIGLAGDTMLVALEHSTQGSYPFAVLQSLEVRGGKDHKRGAVIGAGIIGGIGLVFGGIDLAHDKISSGDFVGTVVGNSVIGALLGFALAPKGWERVPLVRR